MLSPLKILVRRCLFILLFIFPLALAALAQSTIKGTVTDQTNKTRLEGVSVELKGTTIGTVTDANGNFSLSVPNLKGTLVLTSVGYNKQEVPVNNRTTVNVELSNTTTNLNEVVVCRLRNAKEKRYYRLCSIH